MNATFFRLSTLIAALSWIPAFLAAEPAGSARVQVGGKGKINLTAGKTTPGGSMANITWGSEDERKKTLTAEIPLQEGWSEFSVSFTPDASGVVQIDLSGADRSGPDKKKRALYTYFDDLSATGADLAGGDFEVVEDGKPAHWWFWSPDTNRPGMAVRNPALAHGGNFFVAAWAQGALVRNLTVKAGETVTLRGFAKPAPEGIDPRALSLPPPPKEPRKLPVNPRLSFFDLAPAANMGFQDDAAGDGKGGWSDQGPGNDFREFDLGQKTFGDVPFRITDPAANGGKAVLSFRHDPSFLTGLEKATIPAPPKSIGRYLYLLHTSCWFGLKEGETAATVTVGFADGSKRVLEVQGKREVGDWWNPPRLENGVVVVSKANQSALVGIYLSRFDLGAQMEVKRLEFSTGAKLLWIVVGATLSDGDYPLPEIRKLEIRAGKEWRALPDADLAVKAGTALDFSHWIDPSPAGSKGRVIGRPDGTLAFAKEPAKPVRFYTACGFPTESNAGELAEAYAETIYRQGYNLVRLHFVDQYLTAQTVGTWGKTLSLGAQADFDRRLEAGESAFSPQRLDHIDRFVAALKKRGIYLYLDGMSSWTGLYPANCWYDKNGVEPMKPRIFYDPVARRHYQHALRQFLLRTNAYTGTTLATDPQVAMILGFNEITMGLTQKNAATNLLPQWRAFLASRFPDVKAYRAAYCCPEPNITRFDEAPFFTQGDLWHEARRKVVAAFLNQLEEETSGWMEKELRGLGYTGLYTMYDWLYSLRLYLARAKAGVVSMHGYFSHPFELGGKQAVSQGSSLAADLNWWRAMAATRIAGEPFALMEYGHVYWNRYRYEEGLAIGAYASFQDHAALTGFAWPVGLAPKLSAPFNVGADPIGRASQVVSGLLFMDRAASVAAHRVDIPLSRGLALDRHEHAISGDQSRLALLTGFAVAVEGRECAVKPALQIPMGDGAKTVDSAFWSSVVDAESGTFAGALERLRKEGILPAKNRTDLAKKIYETENGEILLESGKRRLTVETPRLAGLCTDRWESPLRAGPLIVESSSEPASITLASRDGQALGLARRLLLVIATDARNSDSRYEDEEGVVMKDKGKLPLLMKTAKLSLRLERAPSAGPLKAWALALDGTRRDELAVKPAPGGLRLELDSGAWDCGATPFVELAER
ncbi:MAG: hypothetical protein J0L75_07255 [Spirochaetes bacterium]|nr:hypothetical protein [Spirochaetota bacterium]